MRKRKLDICVISDAHLGTYGCYADELLTYLSSIDTKTLILNGDMIDIWQFKTSYFPPSHLNVVKKILSMASQGTKVYYIQGNHDDIKARFAGMDLGMITFCKKLVLDLNGKKTWFFHGDIFDVPFLPVKWLAKLGTLGFDMVLSLNKTVNWFLKKRKKEKFSLSDKIRKDANDSVRYIEDFERKVVDLALEGNFDTVVCGHIHKPKKQLIEREHGNLLYLNSGDWVEHMTAMEYSFKRWKLYRYEHDKLSPFFVDSTLKEMNINELISTIATKKTKNNFIRCQSQIRYSKASFRILTGCFAILLVPSKI